MRSMNGLAVLNHEKVLLNGVKVSLLEAFTKTEDANGYPSLAIKDNVNKLDGTPLTLDDPYLKEVKAKIKSCSDECFGAFSPNDKGVINQYWLGRLAMNFRQWMVEHYSRRYRPKHWDTNKRDYTEGYYITFFKTLGSLFKGLKEHENLINLWKNELSEDSRVGSKKAITEFAMWAGLAGLSSFLAGGDAEDDDDDEKEDWYKRFLQYNTSRMLKETTAAAPFGIASEFENTLRGLIPANSLVKGVLYPVTGLVEGDLLEENEETGEYELERIEKGRHKGWSRYGRNVLWYSVPFYKQIDQLIHMDEEDNLFTIFTNKKL